MPKLCPASFFTSVSPALYAALETRIAVRSKPFCSCSAPPITLSVPRPARLKKPPVSAVTPTSMSPDTAAAAIGWAASKKTNSTGAPALAK